MSGIDGTIHVEEAAALLGVGVRRVEQLVVAGELVRVAYGLVDAASVHHHLAMRQNGSGTRVWSPATAWAAVAMLSGVEAAWLGNAQRSRLRRTLPRLAAADLVRRTRNRAQVRRFGGHRSVAARLTEELVVSPDRSLGLVVVDDRSGADGYLDADELERIVATYALRADATGPYVLRTTAFDIAAVARVAVADDTLIALDAAASLAPRERSAGMRLLDERLSRFGNRR